MLGFLTHFYRENNSAPDLTPDFCEKIGRIGLGLPCIAFGRTIKVESNAFNEDKYSLVARVAAAALIIIFLPITGLLAGIGYAGLTFSANHQKLLDKFTQLTSKPAANGPIGGGASNNLPTGSTTNSNPITEPSIQEITNNKLEAIIPKLDLTIPEGRIDVGQGEYIVFHHLPNNEIKAVEEITFKQVYQILNEYSPAAIVNKGTFSTECANRYEIMSAKIKEIDPTLEIVFIPRTLYELNFVQAVISEDLEGGTVCQDARTSRVTLETFEDDKKKFNSYLEKRAERLAKKKIKCWHLVDFDEASPCENNHPGVIKAAYLLNQLALETLPITPKGFTKKEFTELTEKRIKALKKYHANCSEKLQEYYKKSRFGNKVDVKDIPMIITKNNHFFSGPALDFGFEHTQCEPTGIRDEKDASIIRNAIAVECSKAAQTAFCLFRGSEDFAKDFPYSSSNQDTVFSISYGLSLLAGCTYSRSTLFFMRHRQSASVTLVPFDQLNDSPFYIPPTNTVAQLYAIGHHYCCRSKIWKDWNSKVRGRGVLFEDADLQRLQSHLPKEEFLAQFQRYKDHRTVHLKA